MKTTGAQPEGAGFAAWMAHRWWWFIALVTATSVSRVAVTALTADDSPLRVTVLIVDVLVVAVFAVGLFAVRRHFSRLCAPCMAAVPADGQARAASRRWLLRAFHGAGGMFGVLLLATAYFGLGLVLPMTGLVALGSTAAVGLNAAGFLLFVVADAALAMVHRPLVPWCPYCNWPDDGDAPDEISPIPTPPARTPHSVLG